MAAYQLPPVPRPLAVFGHMTARETQTLVLKEKSLDDFDISDLNGTRRMHIEGKAATMHARKKVYDPKGAMLFDIVKEHLHRHTTYSCQDENKKEYMQVQKKFALTGSKAEATFTATDGTQATLQMNGNWRDTTAEIVDAQSGAVAARIDRKVFNLREAVMDHQTYYLTVAPGVDVALMVALCVCLDEMQNESKGAAII